MKVMRLSMALYYSANVRSKICHFNTIEGFRTIGVAID